METEKEALYQLLQEIREEIDRMKRKTVRMRLMSGGCRWPLILSKGN